MSDLWPAFLIEFYVPHDVAFACINALWETHIECFDWFWDRWLLDSGQARSLGRLREQVGLLWFGLFGSTTHPSIDHDFKVLFLLHLLESLLGLLLFYLNLLDLVERGEGGVLGQGELLI